MGEGLDSFWRVVIVGRGLVLHSYSNTHGILFLSFFLFSSFHLCDDMPLKTSESENGIEKKNNRFDSNVDSTRPHLVCFDCCFFGGGKR